MLSFLSLNGIRIDATDEDIVQLGLGIADGSVEYEGIVSWIKAHRTEN